MEQIYQTQPDLYIDIIRKIETKFRQFVALFYLQGENHKIHSWKLLIEVQYNIIK